jgi:FkbM family methyltransferase
MSDLLVRALRPIWFRGKARLLTRLVPRNGTRTAHVHGVRMTLDLADLIQRHVYLGCYEPQETRLLKRFLRPGMTVVDAGANMGYFTWLAAQQVGPTGRVLAIEPSPTLFTMLERVHRDTPRSQVTLVNTALGRTAGQLDLYVPPESKGNNSPTLVPTPGWTPVRVPVRTLDDVIAEHGIGTIDLLKMDIEGFETEALAGAERILAEDRIRAVLCEFNDYFLREAGSSPDALFEILADRGFVWDDAPGQKPTFAAGCVVTYLLRRRAGA